jgi:hypothetical protein
LARDKFYHPSPTDLPHIITISVAGNDHYILNTILFSSEVGLEDPACLTQVPLHTGTVGPDLSHMSHCPTGDSHGTPRELMETLQHVRPFWSQIRIAYTPRVEVEAERDQYRTQENGAQIDVFTVSPVLQPAEEH